MENNRLFLDKRVPSPLIPTAVNSSIKEVINDKPQLIKRSEKLIYEISENCLPYDGYVEQMKNMK
jgi:c-di-GMP-related signal transduction protein